MCVERSKTGALIAAAGLIAAGCRPSNPQLEENLSEAHFGNPRTSAALVSRLTSIADSNGNGSFVANDGSTFEFTVHNDGRIRIQRTVVDRGAITSLQVCFENDSIYRADQMETIVSAESELSMQVAPDTSQATLNDLTMQVLSPRR